MFWTLALAHLIGDYPLQTDRLVRLKRRWDGLLLHVAIHLALMLLLSGRDSLRIWPQLLALTAIHYAVDTLKNIETNRWPHVVILPYFLDQLLHILSLYFVARWIEGRHGVYRDADWLIYAVAYLSVTHVWFITERIVAHRRSRYLAAVETYRWSRQLYRAAALTVFLLIGGLLGSLLLPSRLADDAAPLSAPLAALFTGLLPPPYRASPYHRLLLAQDLLGPLLAALLVLFFTA